MPKGLAIDFGRGFGFGYQKSEMPCLSVGWVRLYVITGGIASIVVRFVGSNEDLQWASNEIQRLRALCEHRCPDCPRLHDPGPGPVALPSPDPGSDAP